MKQTRWILNAVFALFALAVLVSPAGARGEAAIPASKIAGLDTQLTEAHENASAARTKLALRRVIREGEALLGQHADAPNRFEVLGVLFRGQQELVELDDTPTNRSAILNTCRRLAQAPNRYAAIRLDADLLLSQVELAKQGADRRARADALRPLVERYRGTAVEAKVIRIALLMALEFGDAALVDDLRELIAERFAGDVDLIRFQRDKLAGQIIGAPFIGLFTRADGEVVRLPMDTLGKTTAVLFWSKDNGGEELLKQLAAAWQEKKEEAAGRIQPISINLDNLPDAGESILREHGLDLPVLHLKGGRDHPIYQAYATQDPSIITVSPTGYAVLFMGGGASDAPRWIGSSLARQWTMPFYTSQLQSLLAGEFLVIDPTGPFDPAAPPEWKAAAFGTPRERARMKRAADSVPEDKLQAIQACFIRAPKRYRMPFDEVRAGYEKAEALCAEAIAAYPSAPDLWIVRNRLIVALMGLWKLSSDNAYLERAANEAQAALAAGYPSGADIVARLSIARQALHAAGADPTTLINDFAHATDEEQTDGPTLIASAMLAMEVGDRRLHEQYRNLVDGEE